MRHLRRGIEFGGVRVKLDFETIQLGSLSDRLSKRQDTNHYSTRRPLIATLEWYALSV
jgi:hypothetical protein